MCEVDNLDLMTAERCGGFRVLPKETFYLIYWKQWEEYFSLQVRDQQSVIQTLNYRKVIGSHVWNKLSSNKPIYKNSNQLYVQLARSSCPFIYEIAPKIF